jgi:hypothetical protein
METNNTYRLKDMYLAAYIFSQGFELKRVDRLGRTCWFVFADRKSCEVLANQYLTNKAEAKIKSFVEAIQSLKDIIFAQT